MLTAQILITEEDGTQEPLGSFVLRDGRIEMVADKDNLGLLKELLQKPVRNKGKSIDAADDPKAWLEGLPMTYRGSRLVAELQMTVTDEDLLAYEKERLAHVEKLAKLGRPVAVKGPKWVPPKLNDDGSLADEERK